MDMHAKKNIGNLLYKTFHEARKGGGHESIEKVLVD